MDTSVLTVQSSPGSVSTSLERPSTLEHTLMSPLVDMVGGDMQVCVCAWNFYYFMSSISSSSSTFGIILLFGSLLLRCHHHHIMLAPLKEVVEARFFF